ncbi:hypothetical protein TWF481_009101 [Arthrobotrys musiformis]|uniref:Nucleoside phosphorylase domain-containing protein n=1 Tax=Arthrobotrys musiformis TaxID=47236 RepID=A0AAV9W4I2_9PEZI
MPQLGIKGTPEAPAAGQDPPPYKQQQQRSHHDYTIGWICALSKELTAAKVMLDDIHPSLPKPSGDTNTYTLGSIGKHNVVIACLPEGMIGTNQAAVIATRLVGTFPAVKVGFMVGIGGGIPPVVSLGDVVVSKPTGGYPGVVQWDMGKMESGGQFKRTGALNKPPKALLTALTDLKSDQEIYGTKFEQRLNYIRSTFANLDKKYRRPSGKHTSYPGDSKEEPKTGKNPALGFWQFILFILRYIFGGWALGPVEYTPTHKVTATQEFQQSPQAEVADEVKVHYGLIASGNQVIKDAAFRERINENLGGQVLCVEMEAAGLMDDFPCIVIRGICDYADERKNDDWHDYAAAVAAAYARDFIEHLQADEVDKEPSARDIILNKLDENIAKLTSRLESADDLGILEWLTPEPFQHSGRHNDVIERRQPGSGQWFLKSEEFHTWLQNKGRILFCPGIPGAGKTFLTSTVVDKLFQLFDKTPDIGIAFVYFIYARQAGQTAHSLLSNILNQLARQQPSMPEALKTLHDSHKKRGTHPNLAEITEVLQAIISASYSRVFIVVDALDECQTEYPDYCRNKFLSTIFQLSTQLGVNVLATSRHIEDIIGQFKVQKSTLLEVRADEADLRLYLDGRIMQSNRGVLQKNSQLIKDGIVGVVEGMFLLARLHFEMVESIMTRNKLEIALKNLATGKQGEAAYAFAYGEAMKRIDSQNGSFKNLARRALPWVVCAERPLTEFELQVVLAVEPDNKDQHHVDEGDFPEIADIVSVCAGLITIEENSRIVRLIHYTAQEYLSRQSWVEDFQKDIANTCVVCMSGREPNPSHTVPVGRLSRLQRDRGMRGRPADIGYLHTYFKDNWGHHASKHPERAMQPIISEFFKDKDYNKILFYAVEGRSTEGMEGLHIAAYFGLSEYIEQSLSEGADKDARDYSSGQTALSIAAEKGHVSTMELLLRWGADKEARDERGNTPLSTAAWHGASRAVELLLREGANHLTRNNYGGTCFGSAVSSGDAATLEMLLHHNAWEIPESDKLDGEHLLWLAATYGDTAVMELLFRLSARHQIDAPYDATDHWDPYGRRDSRETPLIAAAFRGREDIVRILVREGADIEAGKGSQSAITPLIAAADRGHSDVVEFLISRGADIEARDCNLRTPLLRVLECGRVGMADLLLRHGAKTEAKSTSDRGILSYAAEAGHVELVSVLLRGGADINEKDCDGLPPLHYAIVKDRVKVVEILLQEGADYNICDDDGETPLMWVAMREARSRAEKFVMGIIRPKRIVHMPMAELLLQKCADINLEAKDKAGRTALFHAAKMGKGGLLELLLQWGAELESRDNDGRTALSLAAEFGHLSIVRILLREGAQPNVVDNMGRTALFWSLIRCNDDLQRCIQLVELLLKRNPDLLLEDRDGRTVLSLAAERARPVKILSLLLENGSNVHQRDNQGRSPLSWAVAEVGRRPNADFLLANGAKLEDRSNNGMTAILWASRAGDDDMIESLLSKGADWRDKDNDGRTALSWVAASELGNRSYAMGLLLGHGADLNETDNERRTPLSWAAGSGGHRAVMFLLKKGADREIQDVRGKTPLSWAEESGFTEVAESLRAYSYPDPTGYSSELSCE